ncbi:MAG TPA: hypothetical protein V6D47_04680 [Oscillatoriaceae cyanobacterium]
MANAGAIAGTVLGPDAGLISSNLASIVSGNTAALVANNGAGMVSNNGAGLIGNNGSSYRLLDWSPKPAAKVQVSVVDSAGKLLAGPVSSGDDGSFKLSGLKPSSALVFVQATYTVHGVTGTLAAAIAAPRHADASGVRIDPATTLVAKKAERLLATGSLTESQLDPAALAHAANALATFLSPLAGAAGAALDAAQASQVFDTMSTQSADLKTQLSQALGTVSGSDLLASAPIDASDALPTPPPQSSGGSGGGGSGGGGTTTSTPPPLLQPDEVAGHAGGTLYFEGQDLTSDWQVHLPGGQTLGLTALGAQRGRIVLPAGMTSGDLSVTGNGNTFGPWPFHALAYALGAQPDGITCDQTGAGRPAPVLATARSGAAAVQNGDYVYVVGGDSGSGALTSVERALVNADGTLGAFSAIATLQTARSQASCLVSGGYLYVLGGQSGGAALDSIERAAINTDGSLGAFASAGHLSTARWGFTCQRIGGGVYAIGGSNDNGALGSLERAPLNADGTLGQFASVTATLVTPRYGHGAACVGDYLYVYGGSNHSTLDTVERAPVNADGTLGAFATTALHLAAARSAFASAVVDHTLVIAGGDANGTPLRSVETASFEGDGTLDAFSTVSGLSLADARSSAAGLAVDNRLDLIGGTDGTVQSDIERLGLVATGDLGPFAASTNGLTTKRSYFGAVALGRYVYAIGGVPGTGQGDPSAGVERAEIGSDGTLGAFSDAGITLQTPRSCFSLAHVGSTLYVIGGAGGDENATPLNTVESATIGADGTLGAFAPVAGLTLNVARKKAPAVVIGNYLYIVGGDTGGGSDAGIATIERAPINPDGTLGSFTVLTGQLTRPRIYHACAVLGGKLYVIGGENNDATSIDTVEAATINADGTLGPFATVAGVTLAHARGEFATALLGQYLYVFCGWSSTGGILSDVERAPVNPDGTLGNFSAYTNSAVAARDEGAAIVTCDGVYLLGGDGLSSVERAPLQ